VTASCCTINASAATSTLPIDIILLTILTTFAVPTPPVKGHLLKGAIWNSLRCSCANSVVAAGGPARVKIFIHELIELSLALTGYGLFLRRFDC
jgi:hypothetical protein